VTQHRGRFHFAVQIASLCTTGVALWLGSSGFRTSRAPLSLVVVQAFLFAFGAWLASAGIALLLYLTIPRRAGEYELLQSLRTSAVAVWFAPATILLTRVSAATLLAALALVVTATRLLYSEWRRIHPMPEAAFETGLGLLFGDYFVPRPLVRREFLGAMTVSLALQCAATARLFRHPLAAGALFVMTVASLTLFAMTSGAMAAGCPRNLPQTAFGILLTIFLAAGITIGGLRPRGFFQGDEGDGDADGPTAATPTQGTASRAAASKPAPVAGIGSFPGVILRPETKPFVRLVEPPPVRGGMGFSPPRGYAIPFDGEYWVYRFLYNRPPAKSIEERGTPSELSYRTVDRWPLVMEAHQKLDPAIDLACRAVRVEIWNADRYPNTVSLELDALAGKGWTSIGAQPVRSVPERDGGRVIAAAESLEFPIRAPVRDCMELKVLFLRDRSRSDRSAMIAVDRFVLLP
jgi:hypothetical protein